MNSYKAKEMAHMFRMGLLCVIMSFNFVMLVGCGGEKKDKDDNDDKELPVVARIQEAISMNDFAKAYFIVDSETGSYRVKYNQMVLDAEIAYLMGDNCEPKEKATKILITIQQRAKYNVDYYDVYVEMDEDDVKNEAKIKKQLLGDAIQLARSSEQDEVAEKLQKAYDIVEADVEKIEELEAQEKAKKEEERKERLRVEAIQDSIRLANEGIVDKIKRWLD